MGSAVDSAGVHMNRPPSRRRTLSRAPRYAVAGLLLGIVPAHAAAQVVDRTVPSAVTNVTKEQLESLPPGRDLKTILDLHNQVRSQVNAPPLQWDPRLAAQAAAYGPQLAQYGRPIHAPREGRKTSRENLLQALPGTSPGAMVGVWIGERDNFVPGIFPDVSRTGNWADVGHYTQMIWPTTTHLGCAIHRGGQFDWLICRYSPPGNQDGDPVIAIPPTRIAQGPVININQSGGEVQQQAAPQEEGTTHPSNRQTADKGTASAPPPATTPASPPGARTETENFRTSRRIAFCGHMWIIVDTYNDSGTKTGELSLHFSPSGYEINPTRQDIYPKGFAFSVESTRDADLRLIEMWRYQIANQGDLVDLPVMGPWSPFNNCWTQSLWWAQYGIEPNEPVRQPEGFPADCEITPEPDWDEKTRRLGLAWDNAQTVGEHFDVLKQGVSEAFRSFTDCFSSDSDE